MSAFMVEDKTINRIIAYLAMEKDGTHWANRELKEKFGFDLKTREGKESLGKALFDLNIAGVNERYGDNEAQQFRPLNYQFRCELPPSPIQALKSLRCLLYQCAEGDVPDQELYKVMQEIGNNIAYYIVSRLDAYQAAVWG